MDNQVPPLPPPPVPPPPPPFTPMGGEPSGNARVPSQNTLMLALAYLWILSLVPLFTEKDDAEVQWHAKNGLCFFLAEIILMVALSILSFIPFLGCVTSIILIVLPLGLLVLHIIAIVKATKGERLIVPGVTDYVTRL